MLHRHTPIFLLSLICALIWLISIPAWAGAPEPIRLGAFEYPPFYYEEAGEVRGIAVDIIDQLFTPMGIRTTIRMLPLKRALGYAREGRIDGIMILIKTEERSAYLHYTEPVLTVRGLIWSRADRPGGPVHFERLEDLRHYVMGATLGYSYGQALDELMETMIVNRAASDYLNYKILLTGRIDIFPGNEIVAKGLFKRHPELRGKFHHSDRSFIEWVLHMGISKRSSLVPLIPRINTALEELKSSGKILETVRRFTE